MDEQGQASNEQGTRYDTIQECILGALAQIKPGNHAVAMVVYIRHEDGQRRGTIKITNGMPANAAMVKMLLDRGYEAKETIESRLGKLQDGLYNYVIVVHWDGQEYKLIVDHLTKLEQAGISLQEAYDAAPKKQGCKGGHCDLDGEGGCSDCGDHGHGHGHTGGMLN